ncbi:hydroxyphenylacetyl-CoA thioesterase PaaI [Gordonia insulae]|uniref:Acyl-coenzyme A thioesterase PaaI n=1 Tax=Gordonia insulae TaxID=2420509 RepID=A0A3G8JN40_9ACTN|nr:hydroxyphenylacetyl-CoA thioesterase PaaI [Gordonia insulae]AZG46025.1 Acyl-coenzyme A thioesterase PaaI [Gordonia insulae]
MSAETAPAPDRLDDHRIARTMFAEDVASRELGITLDDLGPGYARTSMTVTPSMVNGHGITHGGYVFMVADTTFALACNSHDDAAVAARADIRFLRATHEGDVLVAEAVERQRFGRNGIYDVTVKRGDDVIAEFRGDSRTIPAARH